MRLKLPSKAGSFSRSQFQTESMSSLSFSSCRMPICSILTFLANVEIDPETAIKNLEYDGFTLGDLPLLFRTPSGIDIASCSACTTLICNMSNGSLVPGACFLRASIALASDVTHDRSCYHDPICFANLSGNNKFAEGLIRYDQDAFKAFLKEDAPDFFVSSLSLQFFKQLATFYFLGFFGRIIKKTSIYHLADIWKVSVEEIFDFFKRNSWRYYLSICTAKAFASYRTVVDIDDLVFSFIKNVLTYWYTGFFSKISFGLTNFRLGEQEISYWILGCLVFVTVSINSWDVICDALKRGLLDLDLAYVSIDDEVHMKLIEQFSVLLRITKNSQNEITFCGKVQESITMIEAEKSSLASKIVHRTIDNSSEAVETHAVTDGSSTIHTTSLATNSKSRKSSRKSRKKKKEKFHKNDDSSSLVPEVNEVNKWNEIGKARREALPARDIYEDLAEENNLAHECKDTPEEAEEEEAASNNEEPVTGAKKEEFLNKRWGDYEEEASEDKAGDDRDMAEEEDPKACEEKTPEAGNAKVKNAATNISNKKRKAIA